VSDPGAVRRIELILLDIEGTTTPIAFVADVLFPYARRQLRSHLETHCGSAEYASILTQLRAEHAAALRAGEPVLPWSDASAAVDLAGAITFVEWLMDRDRKSSPLKDLQGKIWDSGYRCGELVGQVFPDVPAALRRWRDQQLQAGIFSSGSVLAQQLLFRHSSAGDLTPLLQWYFDTRVGAKGDAESYRRIAQAVGMPASAILFLSDTPRELDAAQAAGLPVRLVVRPGHPPLETPQHPMIRSLDQVTTRDLV
jgi:enolase-phosphatase E1